MQQQTARFWLGIALPATTIAAGLGSWLLWRNELPSRIATHFELGGDADGSSSLNGVLLSLGIPLVLGALLCVAAAAGANRFPRQMVASVAFVGGAFASLLAAMLATTVWTQRGIADWTEAHLSPLVLIAVVVIGIGAGLVAGWLGSFLGEPEKRAQRGDHAAPVMELSDGEQAVWVTSQTFKPAVGIALAVITGCLVARVVLLDRWLSIAAPCFIAVIVLGFASYRVRVDGRGLHVRSTVWPRPALHIATEDIETASVIDVRPKDWGGWGYRGSLKLMKKAALIQRAGPGVRVDLHDGRVFVVTADRPDKPVALLNAYAQRQTTSGAQAG